MIVLQSQLIGVAGPLPINQKSVVGIPSLGGEGQGELNHRGLASAMIKAMRLSSRCVTVIFPFVFLIFNFLLKPLQLKFDQADLRLIKHFWPPSPLPLFYPA
jgi:hypothetical protein